MVDFSSEKYNGLFFSSQELLVPVKKITVMKRMVRLELAYPQLSTDCSSHRAIQLKSYCWERLNLSSWRIAILYIYIISQLWLTSYPKDTAVLLDTGTPGTSREIYSEAADGKTRTRNP